MKQAQRTGGSNDTHGNDDHAALVILSTLADTTWRIFIPVLSAASLGLWADVHWRAMPWMTLSGMVLGFIAAGLLIRSQLRAVAASEKTTKKKKSIT